MYILGNTFENNTLCPNCNHAVLKRNRFEVMENK